MRTTIVAIILIVAVISAYAGVRGNGFVSYDDPMYVTNCPQVQKGLTSEGVQWAFTNFDALNWHPLTWLSHMLDCQLFGENAGMHHLVNVGLHAINALLVLACFTMLTGAFWPSAAAALVWAIHPLRVESVAWIAERKDLLSAMFGLLCIMAHARFARNPTTGRGFLVLLALALGLMCKPMLVTWPFLLLVLDFWPLRRWDGLPAATRAAASEQDNPLISIGSLISEKIPLLVICAIVGMLTVQAQRAGDAMADTSQSSIGSRIANALVSYVRYMADLFWPHDLAVLYPQPDHWSMRTVLGAASLLAAITVISLVLRKRMPWMLVGWLWFLGTLVPVIGLVQVGVQSMADRYTYLPQLGLLLALWMTLDKLVGMRAAVTFVAALALSIPLWIGTRQQVRVWRDSDSLYEHALSVTEGSWVVHSNMAVLDMDRGRLEAAEAHLREGLRLDPNHFALHANLAEIMCRRENFIEAIRHLDEAIRLNPQSLAARNKLAWVLVTARSPVLRDPNRAVKLAEQVCAEADHNSSVYPWYLDTLAMAYAAAGRFDDAIRTAQRALENTDPARQGDLRSKLQQSIQQYMRRQPPT